MKIAGAAFALLLAVLALAVTGEAHKAITSKFTYNADVYPIFLSRCGHCHVMGGVGPMSLLRYEDAFPWAEAFRTELLEAGETGANEPNRGEDFITTAHRELSARELDVILDWATGGTPEGDAAKAPPPVVVTNVWSHGEPHLALQVATPYEMPADAMESTQEFVLPVALTRPREVSAIDVLPGTPAIVRDVALQIRSGTNPVRTLGTWTPRQNPAPVVLRPAVSLAPGSQLVARIHYKKTWKYEGQPLTDRSTIGLYFTP